MLPAIVCLLALLVIVALARLVLAIGESVRKRPAIDNYVGHTIALHLTSKRSLQGTLVEAAPDALVLANAKHLGSTVHPLDGRQIIERAKIEFFQVLIATTDAGDGR